MGDGSSCKAAYGWLCTLALLTVLLLAVSLYNSYFPSMIYRAWSFFKRFDFLLLLLFVSVCRLIVLFV